MTFHGTLKLTCCTLKNTQQIKLSLWEEKHTNLLVGHYPNRINYVVSTTIDKIEGALVFKSTKDAINGAINYCNKKNEKEIVVIGGGFLFRDTLSMTNKLVLTKVDCDIAGDVFYPNIDFSEWKELNSESFSKDSNNDYDFIVSTYERVT